MIKWFVTHGPDPSHLWDSQVFDRLKDAKAYAAQLPPAPIGNSQSYKIERYDYKESQVYGDIVETRLIEKNY